MERAKADNIRVNRSGSARTTTRTAGVGPSSERILPWLSAAVFAATCYLAGLTWGLPMSVSDGAALLMVLAGTLAAAGLLAARSTRAAEATEREERARPAGDELTGMTDEDSFVETRAPAYLQGMAQWTAALVDLFDHAAGVCDEDDTARELADAADDTRALHDLLIEGADRHLSLSEAAMLHSVATLWETDQERLEQLAASVDPPWHRRWDARSIIERQLRHGRPGTEHLVLPYR